MVLCAQLHPQKRLKGNKKIPKLRLIHARLLEAISYRYHKISRPPALELHRV